MGRKPSLRYKGYMIQVDILNHEEVISKNDDKDALEAVLSDVLFRYLEAFGEIPKPLPDLKRERDSTPHDTIQDSFYNFHDLDGEMWALQYVKIYHDRLVFMMAYAL